MSKSAEYSICMVVSATLLYRMLIRFLFLWWVIMNFGGLRKWNVDYHTKSSQIGVDIDNEGLKRALI